MSKSAGFTITFKAVDGATTTIQSINKQLASLTKPIQAFDRAGKGFGGVQGLNSLTQSMKQFGGETFNTFRSMDRLIPSLGIITSAGTIGGMVALAKAWGDTGVQIGQASRKIGIAASTLNTLQAAGRLAGVTTEQMTEALGGLATHMRDALGGRDTNANVMMMTLFGKDGPEKMKEDLTRLLPEIMDKIKAIRNPQDQQRAADALGLGGILTIMQQGGAAFEEYIRHAKELSGQTDEDIKKQEAFAKSVRGVEEAVRGVWLEMGNRTTYLTPYLDQLTAWIASHKTLAADLALLGGAMAAIKPAAWLLRLLGLTEAAGAAATIATSPITAAGATGVLAPALAGSDITSGGGLVGPLAKGFVDWLTGGGSGRSTPALAGPRAVRPGGQGEDVTREAPNLGAGPRLPRGLRNNNPLNLEFRQGQGASGTDGRFGIYPTMEAGVRAAERQLLRYQDVYQRNSISDIINRWSPSSDPSNPAGSTQAYIQNVARALGMDPNAPVNLHDPGTLRRLVGAMAHVENGRVVDVGEAGTGGRPAPPNGVPTVGPTFGPQTLPSMGYSGEGDQRGHVQVDVHIKGPAGTSAQSSSKGPVISPPPKVSETMPTGGTG